MNCFCLPTLPFLLGRWGNPLPVLYLGSGWEDWFIFLFKGELEIQPGSLLFFYFNWDAVVAAHILRLATVCSPASSSSLPHLSHVLGS